ncbi:hypothetical protein ACFY4C_06735 [Actinomadura viridis]|uniref:hypothetical protein n=1 Tax=Actinomadura viridis TaxID=58110 RepID=UPI003699D339
MELQQMRYVLAVAETGSAGASCPRSRHQAGHEPTEALNHPPPELLRIRRS